MAKTKSMIELIDLKEADLNADEKRVRVTLIRPGWSSNGRYYSPEVIAASKGLWEGAKAFRDHPSRSDMTNRPERSIADLIGVYENVKIESDGRLAADLLVEDEAMWNKITFAATKRPDYLGLSINAIGSVKAGKVDGKAGDIVESIVRANSTDIVTVPAAGGRVENLLMSGGGELSNFIEVVPLDELSEVIREARPDFVEALKKEWKVQRDTEAVKAARDDHAKVSEALTEAQTKVAELTESNTALQGKLAEAEKQLESVKRDAMLDKVLSTSKLPEAWVKSLRETLVAAKPEEWESIIKAEMDKARSAASKVQVTGAGITEAKATVIEAPINAAGSLIAESLGIDPKLAQAKDFNEYKKLKGNK